MDKKWLYSVCHKNIMRYRWVYRVVAKSVNLVRFAKTYVYGIKCRLNKGNSPSRKVTFVFVCNMPEVWNSFKSLYEEVTSRDDTIGYIIAHPKDLNNPDNNEMYDYLKTISINAIKAYSYGQWFDVTSLNPDYFFYTRTYIKEYYDNYQPKYLRRYGRICVIPYGYSVDDEEIFKTIFNQWFITNVSYLFHCNKDSCLQNKARFRVPYILGWIKLLNLGYPRFDLIRQMEYNKKDIFTVLWIPRFPIRKDENNIGGHFLDYFYKLYDFFEKSVDCKLIIRPHPLMFERYCAYGMMVESDVNMLQEKVNNSDNVEWDLEKDYLIAMRRSDIMIADVSSLIAEYVVFGKPIIFCDNTNTFNEQMKKIAKSFYYVNGHEELLETICSLRKGIDPNSTLRDIARKELIPNNEKPVSEKIVEYLLKEYIK